MSAEIVIAVLSLVLVLQQVCWSRIVLHLTNRLMSRNYAEVVQVENLRKQKPMPPDEPETIFDPEDQRKAQELNSLFGVS